MAMTEKLITCIICPIGCNITVRGEGAEISDMQGNQCKRGMEYASNEFAHPVRILTTTVRVLGADRPLIPVRSDKPIPKELLLQCMETIKTAVAETPIHRYDILVPNILGTGANIVATDEII